MTNSIIRPLTGVLLVSALALTGCAPGQVSGTATATSAEQVKPVSIQQRWWNWAAAEKTATNPVADRSGAHCARNQPADVWFFAGTFGETVRRKCTVPAGRPIVAPLVNRVATEPADCTEFLETTTGKAKLDGKPLTPERMENEQIVYRGVEGNPLTKTSDQYEGTACGLWVRIPAPAAGTHELTIQGESGDFAVRADYTFEVTAQQ